SIGSEIVSQIINFNPETILLVDQAETALYDLVTGIVKNVKHIKIIPYVADVKDMQMMDFIFNEYKPQVVYHAAAYKHVPLMEGNPYQAVYTNIIGTKNIVDLSVKYSIESFVMISTDKAVNPSNIMGASKRIAEQYVQSLSFEIGKNKTSKTKIITTRFGNVLGSNGSVVPLFTKQIQEGGPLTVTHPDIIRYFMTIPEACQLVLEAGSMGNGGEIYIFDMGKPVKIIDLAYKMIKLAGFIPDKEIEVKIVGLRPGEKLYEELLNDSSKTLKTHHEKIMISKEVDELNYETINNDIELLRELISTFEVNEIVKKMKKMVPEFISLNSSFEKLDN
ncbi:MAG: UDP-N-acetylglucosamine 4,6-dehydratase family protein, partial [Flavobacterium sp.]